MSYYKDNIVIINIIDTNNKIYQVNICIEDIYKSKLYNELIKFNTINREDLKFINYYYMFSFIFENNKENNSNKAVLKYIQYNSSLFNSNLNITLKLKLIDLLLLVNNSNYEHNYKDNDSIKNNYKNNDNKKDTSNNELTLFDKNKLDKAINKLKVKKQKQKELDIEYKIIQMKNLNSFKMKLILLIFYSKDFIHKLNNLQSNLNYELKNSKLSAIKEENNLRQKQENEMQEKQFSVSNNINDNIDMNELVNKHIEELNKFYLVNKDKEIETINNYKEVFFKKYLIEELYSKLFLDDNSNFIIEYLTIDKVRFYNNNLITNNLNSKTIVKFKLSNTNNNNNNNKCSDLILDNIMYCNNLYSDFSNSMSNKLISKSFIDNEYFNLDSSNNINNVNNKKSNKSGIGFNTNFFKDYFKSKTDESNNLQEEPIKIDKMIEVLNTTKKFFSSHLRKMVLFSIISCSLDSLINNNNTNTTNNSFKSLNDKKNVNSIGNKIEFDYTINNYFSINKGLKKVSSCFNKGRSLFNNQIYSYSSIGTNYNITALINIMYFDNYKEEGNDPDFIINVKEYTNIKEELIYNNLINYKKARNTDLNKSSVYIEKYVNSNINIVINFEESSFKEKCFNSNNLFQRLDNIFTKTVFICNKFNINKIFIPSLNILKYYCNTEYFVKSIKPDVSSIDFTKVLYKVINKNIIEKNM